MTARASGEEQPDLRQGQPVTRPLRGAAPATAPRRRRCCPHRRSAPGPAAAASPRRCAGAPGVRSRRRRTPGRAGRARCGRSRAAARLPRRSKQAAEHPLVDEAQLGAPACAPACARAPVVEAEADPQVPPRGRRAVAPASDRSSRDGRAARRPRRATARSTCPGAGHRSRSGPSARPRSPPGRAGRGVPEGWSTATEVKVAPTTCRSRPRRTTSTSGSSGTGQDWGLGPGSAGPAGSPRRSTISPYAVSAAACSASFLERPRPLP